MYTNEFINELITCEKQIIEPPSKDFKEERGHLKKTFTLKSIDGKFQFNAFIRYNSKFKENFSVGLDYNPKEEKGTICLIRCNGPHCENINFPHHISAHIHKASVETINSGQKPERNAEETNEYATLEEAIQFFTNFVNITSSDKKKYFPLTQQELEFKNE